MARLTTPTDRGAFLDIALDFMFCGLFPLGFALHDPATSTLPAAVLVCSFIGTGSSFLAFSIIAEKRGFRSADYPTKGIYYLGGLTEGTETIALFVAICLFPGAFPWLAYGFAALCAVTTLTRWLAGWRYSASALNLFGLQISRGFGGRAPNWSDRASGSKNGTSAPSTSRIASATPRSTPGGSEGSAYDNPETCRSDHP